VKVNQSSPIAIYTQWSSEPPTEPGTYWFRRAPISGHHGARARD